MAQALCSRAVTAAPVAAPARLGTAKALRANVGLQFAPLSRRVAVRASAEENKQIVKEDAHAAIATTMAASVFSALATAPSASAAELVAQLAADDSRGLVLLGVLVPALGWVLFNILKPALNQLDKMQGTKALRAGVAGAGISAAAGLMMAENADAAELVAQLAADDNRFFFILFPVVPALGWVLFNILKPALNQINKMAGNPVPSATVRKTIKKAGALVGAGGLMSLTAGSADAAQEVATLAADNRPLVLLFVLIPAVGWVLFNILKPALNQINKMTTKK